MAAALATDGPQVELKNELTLAWMVLF
jgi:hypothetical protein